jgi:undecaprenyl-diphosphatase
MESFNQSVFLYLNAPADAGALVLAVARFLADDLIWLVPAGLLFGWMFGSDGVRRAMLQATAAGVVALVCAQVIGLVWSHPRPFMIGLGHTYLAHVPDASFPSDHLTLWWAVSFSLLACRWVRAAALAMSLFGLAIAWSRIYLGVHFPLDMIGAVGVALLSALAVTFHRDRYIAPLFTAASALHRVLFAPLIQRGWLRS